MKALIAKQIAEALRQLIKILGTTASHPKVLVLISRLVNDFGISEPNNKLLRELLKSVGSIGTDLSYRYIDQFKLCEKTIEDLNQLTASDNVVLGNAKSLRLKKLGNAAQHRRKKIMMKKSMSSKLFQAQKFDDQIESSASIPVVISSLKLFSQYLQSNPTQKLSLSNLFLVQVPKIPSEIIPPFLNTLTLFAIDSSKGQKRAISLLTSLLKNTDLRSRCRLYLYMINNQLN